MTILRPDLAIIAGNLRPGSKILDVGCGDGQLMLALQQHKNVDARGLEIDGHDVASAVARGLSVVQGDADNDLAAYPHNSFDYAILSQTLQTTRRPDIVLDHLLRIGREAFVSFPNFAYWRVRMALMARGRMPVTAHMPALWYETPNIHHTTIGDFRVFLRDRGVRIKGEWFLSGGMPRGLGSRHCPFACKKETKPNL